MFRLISAIALAVTAVLAQAANAGLIINVSESGNDVVANSSGTLNVTDLTFIPLIGSGQSFIDPSLSEMFMGNPVVAPTNFDGYFGISGPINFGPGSFALADSGTGDFFAFSMIGFGPGPAIALTQGYTSGTALSSQATWNNQTLATLGITPGTYTWTWGAGANADFFTLNAVSAVPEPSSIALLGISISLLLHRRSRRNFSRSIP